MRVPGQILERRVRAGIDSRPVGTALPTDAQWRPCQSSSRADRAHTRGPCWRERRVALDQFLRACLVKLCASGEELAAPCDRRSTGLIRSEKPVKMPISDSTIT